ncbi:MAG: class IV adenylate cyclase [Planctomycetota bacterium]|jgi:predicted adenylyl cyclase CyaB
MTERTEKGRRVEREIKIPCTDRRALRRLLGRLGARSLGEGLERNIVFDNDGALRKSDSMLRLRFWKDNTLTYKGPRRGPNGGIKTRDEIEVLVDDPAAMEGVLVSLGFTRSWIYEKSTEKFVLDTAAVSLDTLPFIGDWVEIEAESDRAISDVAGLLGLSTEATTSATYAEIFSQYLGERGEQFRDLVFDDKEPQ